MNSWKTPKLTQREWERKIESKIFVTGIAPARSSEQLTVMKTQKHIWIQHTSDSYETCRTCGIVKRRDGKNKPCNGPAKLRIVETNKDTKQPSSPPLPAPDGSASDAEWGRVLWGWLRDMLTDAGCCMEFDTEDLMRLAEKHGRAKKVVFNPDIHGFIDAEPGSEIWWWGDDIARNNQPPN